MRLVLTSGQPGLRERKKLQTRETIARVALELFAERGYDQTTLADIADAANISRRTIFGYFPSKEDILFCDAPAFREGLRQRLEQRPPHETTIDALRGFIADADVPDENARLRKRIVAGNDELRLAERAHLASAEELVAESIAKDLDAGPGDIRPGVVAASLIAAFIRMLDQLEHDSGEPVSHERAMAVLDEVLEFVRAGLDGLRQRSPGRAG